MSVTFTLSEPRAMYFNFNDDNTGTSQNSENIPFSAGTHTVTFSQINFISGNNASGFKIVGLENGSNSKDAVNKGQLDSVESSLTNLVNQEISDRQMAVSAEESARIAGDQSLSDRLDVLESDPVSWLGNKQQTTNKQQTNKQQTTT